MLVFPGVYILLGTTGSFQVLERFWCFHFYISCQIKRESTNKNTSFVSPKKGLQKTRQLRESYQCPLKDEIGGLDSFIQAKSFMNVIDVRFVVLRWLLNWCLFFGLFQGKWSNYKHMERHFGASSRKLSLQKRPKPWRWRGRDRKSSAQVSMLQAFGVIFPWQRRDSGYLQRPWRFSSFGSFKSECISNLVIDSWKAGTLLCICKAWPLLVAVQRSDALACPWHMSSCFEQCRELYWTSFQSSFFLYSSWGINLVLGHLWRFSKIHANNPSFSRQSPVTSWCQAHVCLQNVSWIRLLWATYRHLSRNKALV